MTPGPGFKMNKDYPSRVRLEEGTHAKPAKAEYKKGDAEITDAALRFTVDFTPNAAGKCELKGAADFSVCNDKSCKLIRGEALAWQVEVK